MLERDKLRKADAVTAMLVAAFGAWIIAEAVKMPLKDSWGGVKSVWYVSPALMPLIVGGFLILLSIMLFLNAVREIGLKELIASGKRAVAGFRHLSAPTATTVRFLAISAVLFVWIYLFMPRVDFLLGSILFLMTFVGMFHLEDDAALKKVLGFFLAGSAAFLLYFATGLAGIAKAAFAYSGDVLTLAFIVATGFRLSAAAGKDGARRRKIAAAFAVSIFVPLVVCPLFKYGFKVPLPYDGGILRLMDLIKYRLF
jgi:hypothetical protein